MTLISENALQSKLRNSPSRWDWGPSCRHSVYLLQQVWWWTAVGWGLPVEKRVLGLKQEKLFSSQFVEFLTTHKKIKKNTNRAKKFEKKEPLFKPAIIPSICCRAVSSILLASAWVESAVVAWVGSSTWSTSSSSMEARDFIAPSLSYFSSTTKTKRNNGNKEMISR